MWSLPEPRRIATAQITMSVHVLLNSADAIAEFAATIEPVEAGDATLASRNT